MKNAMLQPRELQYHRWVSFATLFRREVMRFLRIPVQSVAAPFLTNLLFLGIFGGFFYGLAPSPDKISRLHILVPGLIFSGVFMSAFQNPVFSLLTMKYMDTLKEYRHYPLGTASFYLGFSLSGALRGVLVGLMIWAAAGVFMGYEIEHPVGFWFSMSVLSFIASASGIACGLRLNSFEKGNFVVSLILTPAMYLGGVFYDVGAVGPALKMTARFDPFTAPISIVRYFYFGTPVSAGFMEIGLTAAVLLFALSYSWRSLDSGVGMVAK